jgi:hypothetical protein
MLLTTKTVRNNSRSKTKTPIKNDKTKTYLANTSPRRKK